MSARVALSFLLVVISLSCQAQFASLQKSVNRSIDKQNWAKARTSILRALKKDSTHTAATFLLARWFLSRHNPAFNIDSASSQNHKAHRFYFATTPKSRGRLIREGLDSIVILTQRRSIDSAAFARAKLINTEGAYISFLSNYPQAESYEEAVSLRDEAAYLDAVSLGTYESYLTFLNRYPLSVRVDEARARYDRLVYESNTRERSLHSYQKFLTEHPATPYRREIEKHIFEIMTAPGLPEDFAKFVASYPLSPFTKNASNLLFHLSGPDESNHDPIFLDDSLRTLLDAGKSFLIPLLKDGKFGLMNERAEIVVSPSYTELPEEYLCGNIQEDILILDGKITNRLGHQVSQDSIIEVDDLGAGFLKVRSGNCIRAIHKSGLRIGDCVENVRMINNRFVALKTNNKWGLYTLSGRPLIGHEWDDITALKNLVILQRETQFYAVTSKMVGGLAGNGELTLGEWYDGIKPWSENIALVHRGHARGLVDQNLNFILPAGQFEIEKTFFGMVMTEQGKKLICNSAGEKLAPEVDDVVSVYPWITARQKDKWSFFRQYDRSFSQDFDSIQIKGIFAIGYDRDSATVYFNANTSRVLQGPTSFVFLPGQDSTGYLLVVYGKARSVYNYRGELVLEGEFDNVQYAGEGLFIVTKKDKKGMVGSGKRVMVPIEYDAISTVSSGVVTFLKAMKFGAYNIRLKKIIKPQFEKNVIAFNDHHLAAYEKGKFHFITWEARQLSKVTFDEARPWSDSLMLIRDEEDWMLFNPFINKILLEGISQVEYVADSPLEKIAILKKGDFFGVWSSVSGMILPLTFSAVINVGSPDHPVYFTEKHIPEASLFIVIYFDENGKFLRREVYEESDYERILCPEN